MLSSAFFWPWKQRDAKLNYIFKNIKAPGSQKPPGAWYFVNGVLLYDY